MLDAGPLSDLTLSRLRGFLTSYCPPVLRGGEKCYLEEVSDKPTRGSQPDTDHR